ncbi:hypothetical protein GRF61_19500 [Azoarcus sp. TTM-91]|uniref:tripartite tricarboxylate transporter TctB family protein n=1 Tax=Azoarcus sp. TTM-91 TaxID=2691581 RepID=UPI00145DE718|nr:tripartite tricarboxylate transporter TctB family protein [Azoarcus sp. TTM-91]NMG36641.1 hypothetical protein [Azoarcus sp. TTM-91]
MKIRILNRQDALAGGLFVLFGLAGAYIASSYAIGTAMRMGAGYFPLVLGGILVLLGLVVGLRSLRLQVAANEAHEVVEALGRGAAGLRRLAGLRPALFVGAGVLAFALLAPHQGLVLATVALTLLSGYAHQEVRIRELLGLSVALAFFGSAVFAYGLGLPLPVLPA